jgi:hypothetical protein
MRWIIKDESSLRGLAGIYGSFRWLVKSMVYFANFQHFLSHVFHTCMRGSIGQSIPQIPFSQLDEHMFYTCACKAYEGWHVLFMLNMSWVVMSPCFAIHVRFSLRICEARIHSIQMVLDLLL